MRGRDYRRLARLSLRARKKTTAQTILGISFGLILLFPLLFIAFGFYGGFSQEVNKDASFRTFYINYKDTDADADVYSNQYDCYEGFEEKIDNLSGVKKNLKFQYVSISNGGSYPSYQLNDGPKQTLSYSDPFSRWSSGYEAGLSIIDAENGPDPFLSCDYNYAPFPLVSGRTFSKDNSCGEIMVSSQFLSDFHYIIPEIIDSTLTLYMRTTKTSLQVSDSETEVNSSSALIASVELAICKQFKIVGIYNSRIYNSKSIRYHSRYIDGNEGTTIRNRDYFWITTDSLGPNGTPIAPKKCMKTSSLDAGVYTQHWYYYSNLPSMLSEEITNEGYAFIPKGLGIISREAINQGYTKSQLLEFTSFNAARNSYDKISEYYKDSYPLPTSSIYDYMPARGPNISHPGFTQYMSFFDVFLYVCLALASFGGVIFVATLLNLLNTLHFSVQSMVGFLGICRAQGLHNKGVIRLFLDQILLIFAYSYISTIIIGGGICVGLKLAFDNAMKNVIKQETSLSLTIQWWYIPIALGVLLVITTLLSFIFSRLLAGKASKTPILDILSEENK